MDDVHDFDQSGVDSTNLAYREVAFVALQKQPALDMHFVAVVRSMAEFSLQVGNFDTSSAWGLQQSNPGMLAAQTVLCAENPPRAPKPEKRQGVPKTEV